MKQVIGILGGMGPRATVVFEQFLISQFSGSDQEIPTIITINDGGIPDRSRFITNQGPDPVPRLQQNLQMLEQMGATVICLPCNTAAAGIIGGRLYTTTSRLLDLPQITATAIQAVSLLRIYILGTAGTIQAGTYQTACAKRNIEYSTPRTTEQQIVDRLIDAIKRDELSVAKILARKVRRLIKRADCDAVLLGCTELPLLQAEIVPPGYQAFDTIAILAKACVSYSQDQMQGELP